MRTEKAKEGAERRSDYRSETNPTTPTSMEVRHDSAQAEPGRAGEGGDKARAEAWRGRFGRAALSPVPSPCFLPQENGERERES